MCIPLSKTVAPNLNGGTEPHKFHTCIHRTLRSCKNKMCVVNFIYIAQNLLSTELLELTDRTPGVRSNPGLDLPVSHRA